MSTTTSRPFGSIVATAAVGLAMLGALASVPSAQAPVHVNRMIEKLA